MRVTVLAGGESDEREVSRVSGTSVAAALRSAGHTVRLLDPALWPSPAVPLERVPERAPDEAEAAVLADTFAGNLANSAYWEELRDADVVFSALHGGWGESGHLQAACEVQGVPITGTTAASMMMAWDKGLTLSCLRAAGVPVPDGKVVDRDDANNHWLLDLFQNLGRDVIVKPVKGGSSLGVSSATDAAAFLKCVRTGPRRVLVERRMTGREFTVGVVGGTVLPAVEVVAPDGWFGYSAKYQPGASREICPASIPEHRAVALAALTERAVKALGFGSTSYARADFMEAAEGGLRCLEVNSLPGLTPQSLLPLAAAEQGWTYTQLCEAIIASAGASVAERREAGM
jgi:D-alanine-D-alanine ligase